MANKRAPSERMRAMPGHCIVCAGVIPLTDLWCDAHRKHGVMPGYPVTVKDKFGSFTLNWSYEESERTHGDRMRELILKGKV